MTLDDGTAQEILEAYNAGRGRLPRASSVRARRNRRRLISISGNSGAARLNVADAVVEAGPEAWELLGPAITGDRAAFHRLVALTREGLAEAAREQRARRCGARRDGGRGRRLAETPCAGTPQERRVLEAIVEWARETRGWATFFPPALQLRVSRRMTRDFGSYMARGGAFRVTISSRLFRGGLEDILLDTVLHELAHLLHAASDGQGRSDHGPGWKAWCRRLGARPERLAPLDATARVRRANREPEPGSLPEPVKEWLGARKTVPPTTVGSS